MSDNYDFNKLTFPDKYEKKYKQCIEATSEFKQKLKDEGIDIRSVSSKNVILMHLVFNAWALTKPPMSLEVTTDIYHNAYDVAVIIK